MATEVVDVFWAELNFQGLRNDVQNKQVGVLVTLLWGIGWAVEHSVAVVGRARQREAVRTGVWEREKKGEEKNRGVKRGELEGVVAEGRVYESAEKALAYVCG